MRLIGLHIAQDLRISQKDLNSLLYGIQGNSTYFNGGSTF